MCRRLGVAAYFIAAAVNGEPRNAPTPAEPTGTIQGRTIFAGNPDKYLPVPVFPDERFAFCASVPQPLLQEYAVVNRGTHPMTLRNVVVWIQARPDANKSLIPTEPVLLEQRDCRFAPRVVALRAGQTLRVVNRDPDLLNVHSSPRVNEELHYNIAQQGASRDFTFVSERPFPVKQDVHPWMIAWVAVFDHPFFAVTGEEGSFKLADVPPGNYILEAWHETFGILQTNVRLGPGGTGTVDLTFEPPRETP